MIRHYVLDAERNPVQINLDDLAQLARYIDCMEKKHRVAQTQVGPFDISTVFTGIDTGNDPQKPEVFETMIFGSDELSDYQKRCSTWAEAEEMHAKATELAGVEFARMTK